MNASSPLWHIAGWTMLHYLWIGAALGVAAWCVRRLVAPFSAFVHYAAMLACLAVLAASPLPIAWQVARTMPPSTSSNLAHRDPPREPDASIAPLTADGSPREIIELNPNAAASRDVDRAESAPPVGETSPATAARSARESDDTDLSLQSLVPFAPWLWLIGAPVTFGLLATGMVGAERLRRHSRPCQDQAIVAACARLAAVLGVTRHVAVGVCDRIAAPILLGIVRPIILLPPSALTGLSPRALEMVLLHELAHVRRWDNLVNLLQRAVESALFFQPAVWIVSDWVRQDREHCCDALVVAQTGEPRLYAQTLAGLAAQLSRSPSAAALLAEQGGATSIARRHLVHRIRHILHKEQEAMQVSRTSLFATGTLLAVIIAAALWGTAHLLPTAQANQQGSVAQDADEPTDNDESDSAAKTATDQLRYNGKNFGQWRHDLLHDLNPRYRKDALLAMAAFMKNGMASEAIDAVFEVILAQVDADDTSSPGFLHSAGSVIFFAGDPAVNRLCEMRRSSDEDIRMAMVYVVRGIVSAPGLFKARTGRQSLSQDEIERANRVLLELVAATKDPSVPIRLQATRDLCLSLSITRRYVSPTTDEAIHKALLAAFHDDSPEVRRLVIGQRGFAARIGFKEGVVVSPWRGHVLDAVKEAMTDESAQVRQSAVRAYFCTHTASYEPQLLEAALDDDEDVRFVAVDAMRVMRDVEQVKAIGALTEVLNSDQSPRNRRAAQAILAWRKEQAFMIENDRTPEPSHAWTYEQLSKVVEEHRERFKELDLLEPPDSAE